MNGVRRYPEAIKFLLSYTIYADSALTLNSVVNNLFNLSVRPSLVEYTVYSLVGSATSVFGATVFLYLFPLPKFTLRQWAIICYTIMLLVCVWCLLGTSDNVPIGFQYRAELYVFQMVQSLAISILMALFKVLFPKMFPKGSELQYFGFQMVVSQNLSRGWETFPLTYISFWTYSRG